MKVYLHLLSTSVVTFLAICFIQVSATHISRPIIFPDSPRPVSPFSPCRDRTTGASGICRLLSDCPVALTVARASGRHPTLCSYQGLHPVVCCTAINTPPLVISQPITVNDVSQPRVDFVCGRQPPGEFHFRALNLQKNIVAVVGGDTSDVNAWPWMALLGWRQQDGSMQWSCDGSLINEQWIVTAAHCLDSGVPSIVRLGEHDYRDDNDGAPHQDYSVLRAVIYPDYTLAAAYHDLALLQLTRRVKITDRVRPVCLPWGDLLSTNLVGKTLVLTGWGATQFGGGLSSVLQEVNLTVFNTSDCDKNYKRLPQYSREWPRGITDRTFLCVGHPDGGKDACRGDSGGPVVYYVSTVGTVGFVLAGVVSKGYGCGLKDFPGLYAPTHNLEYMAWIKATAFTT